MRSSRLAIAIAIVLVAPRAAAQERAKGFGVERLYPAAPGAGWFVLDTLDMRDGLGGAMAATTSYAKNPLVVRDGGQRLAVVTDASFVDLAFAASYDRFRAYTGFETPLVVKGRSGTVGDYTFTAPNVDPGTQPDALSQVRFGLDARLLGGATDAVRAGLGGELVLPGADPGSTRDGYTTDGTPRAIGRFLVAGDIGALTYAGQLGAHVRPLDDAATPGSPRGSELLFGGAAGLRVPALMRAVAIVGAEVYGATAFQSFFANEATSLEALLTTRLEGTAERGPQLRVKLGAGGGLHAELGAPEARFVFAVELFDRSLRPSPPSTPRETASTGR
jgi:hypothetical protein